MTKTTNRTIRIGVVGAGGTTTKIHIPRFQEIDGVEVVSVANRSRQSSQLVADQFRIPKVYENWSDLIAAPDTDTICIGTWPNMHHRITLMALRKGKHVLTEARMAMDAHQAREMLDESRRWPDLVTQIVPALFTTKIDIPVMNLISDGFLGELLSIDLTDHGGFINKKQLHTWRQDSDISGYNTMMMGPWYECLMRWIGHATSVTSITRVNLPKKPTSTGNLLTTEIPDHVEILCEMESGPIAHMRFSEVIGLTPQTDIWLFGTEGTVHIKGSVDTDHWQVSAGTRGDGSLLKVNVPHDEHSTWRVEENFINAIRGIEPVGLNTFEVGVRYMEFTNAVAYSARSGKTIYLPL